MQLHTYFQLQNYRVVFPTAQKPSLERLRNVGYKLTIEMYQMSPSEEQRWYPPLTTGQYSGYLVTYTGDRTRDEYTKLTDHVSETWIEARLAQSIWNHYQTEGPNTNNLDQYQTEGPKTNKLDQLPNWRTKNQQPGPTTKLKDQKPIIIWKVGTTNWKKRVGVVHPAIYKIIEKC